MKDKRYLHEKISCMTITEKNEIKKNTQSYVFHNTN